MALAQNSFYLDLAGDWLHRSGDNPRYVQSDFDDRDWKLQPVPISSGRNIRKESRFWLRRHIHIPNEALAAPLALTVGAVSEAYEVFVNGQRIGASGPFDADRLQLARARTFDLPKGLATEHSVIAVRVWWPVFNGVGAWRLPDSGPWAISTASLAPRRAGETAIEHEQNDAKLILLLGTALASIMVLVLLIWWSERERQELVWLALFLALAAAGRFSVYFSLTPDAYPWGWGAGVWQHALLQRILPMALLARFLAAFFKVRWMPWVLWPATVLAILLSGNHDAPLWFIYLLILACLASPAPHLSHAVRFWFGAGVVLLVYAHGIGFGGLQALRLPALSSLLIIPGLQAPFANALFLLSIAYSIYLLRTLAIDRVEKQRLDGEMQAARSVQQFLVPVVPASSAAYSIEAVYEPAREVGGDLHWSRVEPDGAVLIVVGDVSGKGLGAAMLVSVIIGSLDGAETGDPAAVLHKLNAVVHRHARGGFVTACCLHAATDGLVSIASAGHPSPYGAAGEVTVDTGLPLGIVPEVDYTASQLSLAHGESITVLTDGVVEAENAQRELFGFDRTREISTQSPKAIAEAAKAWGQNDDITVVTVRRKA